MKRITIHPSDNVEVALEDVSSGGATVARGHKLALRDIRRGEHIVKYGVPIGSATKDIAAGEWVHTHNMKTNLSVKASYEYAPAVTPLPPADPMKFQGYRRTDGRVGIRNELWIIPTVGCVNAVAMRASTENQHLVGGGVEGLYAFTHPFGCSQMGDDHENTKKLLAALARHPNAGGRAGAGPRL